MDNAIPQTDEKQPARKQLRRFGKGTIAITALFGILAGVGTFTFGYGKGASYLSNNPQTCVNCHVMQDHLDSWQHSSHHHVAVCNDCHLPHDPIGKWVTKADNGRLQKPDSNQTSQQASHAKHMCFVPQRLCACAAAGNPGRRHAILRSLSR